MGFLTLVICAVAHKMLSEMNYVLLPITNYQANRYETYIPLVLLPATVARRDGSEFIPIPKGKRSFPEPPPPSFDQHVPRGNERVKFKERH